MSEQIDRLKAGIELIYQCTANHLTSEVVVDAERHWEGVVEKFRLTGHPDAQYCYAWSYGDHPAHSVTILEKPPVDCAATAVKVALSAKARNSAQSGPN